jgi:hypothetical protein
MVPGFVLMVPDGAWWCLMVPDGAWWCLMVPFRVIQTFSGFKKALELIENSLFFFFFLCLFFSASSHAVREHP